MKNNINEKKIKNNKTKFRKEHIAQKKNWCDDKISEKKVSTKCIDKEKRRRKENKKK